MKNTLPYFIAIVFGSLPISLAPAASADLSEAYCRSPQAARDVLAQAKRDHVLDVPSVVIKAQFVSHDRVQGKGVCFFELMTQKGAGYNFLLTRTANGGLRMQFAD